VTDKARNINPLVDMLIIGGKIFGELDQNLEKTLTNLAERFGLSPDQLVNANDLQIIESAKEFEGRAFDVVWTDGYGVTRIEEILQENSDRRPLDTNELKKLTEGANPLAELYVFPAMTKKKGDKWSLDVSKASPLIMAMGDTETDGQIRLRYSKDGTFGKESVRYLLIDGGDIESTIEDGKSELHLGIESMTGEFRVSDEDGMLMMGNGHGKLTYKRISKDHFFFGSRLSRDLTSEWRYEATRIQE
tara:strand:+ start:280 stop:1020 length:741 start_codon:yes stop_codon:yes gene_type:complete